MSTTSNSSIYTSALLLLACFFCPLTLSAQKKVNIGEMRRIWYAPKGSITDSARLEAGHHLSATYSQGNTDSMLYICKEMIAYGQQTNNHKWLMVAWMKVGKYHYMTGNLDSSAAAYRKGISIAQANKSMANLTLGQLGLGRTLGNMGQLDSGIYYVKTALDYTEKSPRPERTNTMHGSLGELYLRKGRYAEALRHLYQSRRDNAQFEAAIGTSYIFKAIGLEDKAKANLAEAMQRSKEASSPTALVKVYACNMALQPTLKEKEYWFHKGMGLADSLKLEYAALLLLTNAAAMYLDSLQLEKAAHCLLRCQTIIGPDKQIYKQAQVALLRSRLEHLRGNFRASSQLCQQILPFYEQNNDWIALSTLYDLQYHNLERLGDPAGALAYIRKKEGAERQLNSKEEINTVLSDYFQQLSASEKAALQTAKANAESLALASKARERLSYGMLGSLCLLFGGASAFFYLFYRQKKKAAEVLSFANQLLAAEQKKLRHSNQKLRQFSGVVSHDILSNLDLILSAGNVLGGTEAPKENLVQYCKITQDSSRRLKDYCLGLLEEARRAPQTAAEPLHDPMPQVHNTLAQFGPALRTARFQVELDELSPVPLPDPVAEQVFQNLVSNALRHGATAPEPRLRIAEEGDGRGGTRWVVEDNGAGLTPEEQAALFEPQAAPTTGKGGQRMGMRLLRDTLREYGADIRAEATAGGGARFVVLFPSA